MKIKLWILFIMLFHWHNSKAQNYVNVTSEYIVNPSFEDYYSCPLMFSQPGSYWIDSCVGWYTPTSATSDFIHVCNNPGLVGVPTNVLAGYQYPFDGDGYCGFITCQIFGNLWSEYIQTELLQSLKAGKKYRFTMRINKSNNHILSVFNIGAHFLSISMQNTSTFPYTVSPTILNQTGYITDTLNWTLIEGEFLASGNENFLTIGWFGDTSSLDFIFGGDYSYYVVDSLNLFEANYTAEDFQFNIITTNNDGNNDALYLSLLDLKQLSFFVYNRWGALVYYSENPLLEWKGTNNFDERLSDGVYYYIITGLPTSDNIPIKIANYLTITH